ncbi:MAG: mechanosensitive ion channel family protein [Actinobacteria bacterium]|nr:mechanosensitive ion channel family protein [Actinomycetota bacterium]
MPVWERITIVAAVLAITAVVAKLIDHAIARRELDPAAKTRYRVLRRTAATAIVAIGVFSALLVIPQVRAIAGGLLASSAVLGLVIGFAARTTLGNFVAGILIAFTQPVRLGDRIVIGEQSGIVEEIGLTYTFVRTDGNSRLVIPNERLASDTIENTTIIDREKVAEVTVQVPLTQDLDAVVGLLREQVASERDPDVEVTDITDKATISLRARAADEHRARELENDLRMRAHRALRAAGMLA